MKSLKMMSFFLIRDGVFLPCFVGRETNAIPQIVVIGPTFGSSRVALII